MESRQSTRDPRPPRRPRWATPVAPLAAALALLAVAALSPAGCAESDAFGDAVTGGGDAAGGGVIGRPCQAHVDCEQQAACLEGVCGRECVADTDCPDPTYTCWGYRCLADGADRDTVGGTDAGGGGGADAFVPECATWADCDQSSPHGCRDGRCVEPECYSRGADAACAALDPARPYCSLYVCQSWDPTQPDVVQPPPDTVATTCATWSECSPQPMACRDGRCVAPECETNADCRATSATASCRLYLCVEPDPPPQDVVQPPPDVVTPPSDVGEPPRDAGPDVPPSPMLGYGETCDPASPHPGGGCASELCLYNKATGAYVCTRECETTFGCPAPDWCGGTDATWPIPGLPIDVCVPSDAGIACAALGDACTSGRSFGAGAFCVCTQPCPNATYCPTDYACVTDGSGERLCRPLGATCTPSETTPDPACAGSICYPLDAQGTTGLCTVPCEDINDCPTGWFCYSENIGRAEPFKSCQRVP